LSIAGPFPFRAAIRKPIPRLSRFIDKEKCMDTAKNRCPNCDGDLDRRGFLRTVGATAAAAAAGTLPLFATPKVQAAPKTTSAAETGVKALYDSLTDEQRKAICFDWDYQHPERGLLRTHVSNNWQITKPHVRSDYYTKKQQDIIHDIWKGIINPDWYARFVKQLKDDTRNQPWGAEQSIAIFGKPGDQEKFEFVITGRHMTLRADGNTESHVAFGGPIFYGHAASGFNEKAGHPFNVFWHQARAANLIYQMLDGKQREKALVSSSPHEADVPFQGEKGTFPGIPVTELADEHKKELQRVLTSLVEPFRVEDREEALDCLKKQGGLDKCSLAFYKDHDLSGQGEYDNWRLEGPAFVWYFRGAPHVHVWVNVADDPSPKLNSKG
jgi:hypothetical protein